MQNIIILNKAGRCKRGKSSEIKVQVIIVHCTLATYMEMTLLIEHVEMKTLLRMRTIYWCAQFYMKRLMIVRLIMFLEMSSMKLPEFSKNTIKNEENIP